VQSHLQQRQAGGQHPPRKLVDSAVPKEVDEPGGIGRSRLVAFEGRKIRVALDEMGLTCAVQVHPVSIFNGERLDPAF
jgi:hypothetical protein